MGNAFKRRKNLSKSHIWLRLRKRYWQEPFRSIIPYWPELFRSINPYWPEQFRSIKPYWPEPFRLIIPCERVEKGSNFEHCPKLPSALCYTLNVQAVCTSTSVFEHTMRKANMLCNNNFYNISWHFLFHYFYLTIKALYKKS